MLPFVEEHRRRNNSTRDRWETMAAHRARVTELILAARGESGKSLCILGAGNGNDIELAALARYFERISLIDLDERALEHAIHFIPSADRGRIELCGRCDLTGVLPSLETILFDADAADHAAAVAVELARTAAVPTCKRFDVVVSACVLTQLIDSVYLAIPRESPARRELVIAIRDRHLQVIVERLNPGGRGILVTDFVATDTAPELPFLSDAELPAAAARWINERNFFTGANPYAIRDQLARMSKPGLTVDNVAVMPAWRWDLGAKQLAVSAVTYRRHE